MPRHLSVATVIEKQKIASKIAFVPLLEIDVVEPKTLTFIETLRFARNSEDLVWQGNSYIAGTFDFTSSAESGSQPTLQVSVNDFSRAIQARMQAYGGGINFTVRVIIVNTGNLDQPAEVLETFTVTGANAKQFMVNFTLGAENPLTMRFPRRRQFRDRCLWRYKGVECGYAGDLPTCDFTLLGGNGCNVHANTARFGGFIGIGVNSQGL